MLAWLSENSDLAQAITAICALLVAVVSLFVARQSMALQRRHNELSLKPVVTINYGDYENYLYLALENLGVGPGTVVEFSVASRAKYLEKDDIWGFIPDLPNGVAWNNYVNKLEGRLVPAGEKVLILAIKDTQFDDALEFEAYKWMLRETLSSMSWKMTFSDSYENSYTRNGDFSWFGRLLPYKTKMIAEVTTRCQGDIEE